MKNKLLIKKGENEKVEFKPSLSQINEIINSISAFSNKNGGKIVIWVSSKGKILWVQIGEDIKGILKTVGSGKRGLRYVLTQKMSKKMSQKMTQKLNEKIWNW